MFLALILLLQSLSVTPEEWTYEPEYVIPENKKYLWKRINASDLECPPLFFSPPLINPSPVYIKTIAIPDEFDSAIEGYICSKLKLSVKCSVNFVGWRTLSHRSEDLRPSLHECDSGLHELLSGNSPNPPEYPAPNCGWMADKWAESVFLIFSPHSVRGDPYTGEVIDRIFPGGVCGAKRCDTVHHGALWISKDRNVKSCYHFQTHWGTLGVSKVRPTTLILHSPHMGFRLLDKACRILFCGQHGVRLSTGEFLLLNLKSSNISLPTFPECGTDAKVSEMNLLGQLDYTRLELLDQDSRLQCLMALSTIVATGKINAFQLGTFTPTHPGPGYAYRLNGNFLEEARVSYLGIHIISTDGRTNRIGYDSNSIEVIWTDWVESPSIQGLLGPNGLVKLSTGQILIPNAELRAQRHNLLLTLTSEITVVEHPHREIEKNFTDGVIVTSRDTGEDGSIHLGAWIKSPTGILVLILIGLVAIILLFICCRCSGSCKCPLSSIQIQRPQPKRPGSGWAGVATTSV
ncbi:MAG: glycoprotein [Nanning Rhabd tick virus 1]|uniref:Glycoprotein n=1 Tax=Nanning Rhabd tick virus 1 TaxID=2972321 RepID=A0A9E7V287_9RHAB|nr:MAG: glycoprotein [Nanning Rhabd tick virus 1]